MKIRTKIMLGFLTLATMLAVAGAFSIYEFRSVGSSVQNLLDDNYQSVTAAKTMIAALEKENRGILLLLSGKWQEGRQMIRDADRVFRDALGNAETHKSVDGSSAPLSKIREHYKDFSRLWDRPIVGTDHEGNLKWYIREVHPRFAAVEAAVQSLININDEFIYETASDLKNRAHQAVMPGIVAILSALVFTLVFNFFINLYVVNPIISLKRAIDTFLNTGEPVRVNIETRDEIRDLGASIADLTTMARFSG